MPESLSARLLKFRAWDTEEHQMLQDWPIDSGTDQSLGAYLDLADILPQDTLHLMQFTGLYARNSQEMYEGDIIISCEDDGLGHQPTYEIVFHEGAFCLTDFPHLLTRVYYRNWYHCSNRKDKEALPVCDFEVIGHIYDPPEQVQERAEVLLESLVNEELEELDDLDQHAFLQSLN